ncbi:MAG TPA: hypothetical protein VG892_07185 [Terriglobales bacterium]|nr:hypothetical protein [Terriglobales bacterium]
MSASLPAIVPPAAPVLSPAPVGIERNVPELCAPEPCAPYEYESGLPERIAFAADQPGWIARSLGSAPAPITVPLTERILKLLDSKLLDNKAGSRNF